jgi:hypothetical protein
VCVAFDIGLCLCVHARNQVVVVQMCCLLLRRKKKSIFDIFMKSLLERK